jgi:hypothetical protein
MTFTNIGEEYYGLLKEITRLTGDTTPMFTTKGKALTDLKYYADKLKNGGTPTYPPYTSEGQLLDDIGTLLSGATLGGAETPTVYNVSVPSQVTGATGSPTGTITVKVYSNRVTLDFNITAAGSFFFNIPRTTIGFPIWKNAQYWEHDLSGTCGVAGNAGSSTIDVTGSGNAVGQVGYIL